jgi:hypothetical protein
MPDQRDDSVGYGRPPKKTRFKKGRSGNPHGRKRGSKNFATILRDALAERIWLTLDGKRMRITVRDALALHLVNGATAGDARLVQILLERGWLDKKGPTIIYICGKDRFL